MQRAGNTELEAKDQLGGWCHFSRDPARSEELPPLYMYVITHTHPYLQIQAQRMWCIYYCYLY